MTHVVERPLAARWVLVWLLCCAGLHAEPWSPQVAISPYKDSLPPSARIYPPTPPSDPGIGFDLTGSYGTVSISYANGTFVDIAKVELGAAYRELLAKWSRLESCHPSPPYRKGEEYNDRPRQRRRAQRKAKGLPASRDVAVLAEMLAALRDRAEAYLGHSISSALAATPNLVASYHEDIEDAFEHIALKSREDPYATWELFRETAAAETAYGFGLCHDYHDAGACRRELESMTDRVVLSVSYTRNSLCVELGIMTHVYRFYPYPAAPPSMDFTVGSDEIHNKPSEAHYWQAVQDTILRGIACGLSFRRRPSVVFLVGESAELPMFRSTLEASLQKILGDVPEILDKHPVFQVARGAAEIAKRGSYKLPDIPDHETELAQWSSSSK